MATRTVLVLGGGVGGIAAANELRRRLQPSDRVVVVEREQRSVFQPSLLWLMVGLRRPDDIARPMRQMLAGGVELEQADVLAVDPVGRVVETSGGRHAADALVVALGAELAPDAADGFADAAHDIYTLEGAAGVARSLDGFRGGRVVVAVAGLPFRCPAAPYEAALLLDDELRRRGVRRSTEIDLYTPEPQPMPVAGPTLGAAVAGLLEARAIGYHPATPIARYDRESQEIVLQGGDRVGYDLLVGVPPHRPPSVLGDSGLTSETGWVPVDRTSLATTFEGVWAVGDVTSIALANGKPLPKAGVFAHEEALVAADRVAAALGRSASGRAFDGAGSCWLETGGGRAAFATGDFYAEPNPTVSLRQPGRLWHAGKVLFERYSLARGLERRLEGMALRAGAGLIGLRAPL